MYWLIFALSNAFFEGLKDILGKLTLNKHNNEYITSFFFRLVPVPFLFIFLLFTGFPQLGEQFYLALLISGSINVATTLLYFKAIKYSDLSVSIPLISFTPVFLLITSPLILGEFPTFIGYIGVLLIFLGAYLLNISKFKKGPLEPIRSLLKEKGPRYILLVAFLWSISASYDKVGVLNSSPIFWVLSVCIFTSLALLPIMLFKTSSKTVMSTLKNNFLGLFLVGFVSMISLISQMIAVSMTLVSYAVSVKRSSSLVVIGLSYFILKEKNIKDKLIGALIMVIGVIVINFSWYFIKYINQLKKIILCQLTL